MVMVLVNNGEILGFCHEQYEPADGSIKLPLPTGYTDKHSLVYVDGVLTLSGPVPPVVVIAGVPQSVTIRQACMQLELDGLLDDVEAVVAALPRIYQIEWQRASVVQRDNPLVEIVRQQKDMTHAQIDDLFIAAFQL